MSGNDIEIKDAQKDPCPACGGTTYLSKNLWTCKCGHWLFDLDPFENWQRERIEGGECARCGFSLPNCNCNGVLEQRGPTRDAILAKLDKIIQLLGTTPVVETCGRCLGEGRTKLKRANTVEKDAPTVEFSLTCQSCQGQGFTIKPRKAEIPNPKTP